MQRSYQQNCALAHALDQVGERWTLLIVRELLVSPRRYSELLENLAGIGTNLLASRLRTLEAQGIIGKSGHLYSLTEFGRRLEPVVHELVRFGLALGIDDDAENLTRPEWDIVALRALYRSDVAAGLEGRYVLELNGFPFCIEKVGDDVNIHNADIDNPRIRVSLSKAIARKLANEEISYNNAVRRKSIRVSGSEREAKKLLRSFSIVP
ncbi:MAG: helix-turn-helix domain-containing protein [Gammaproteobacteria bacterium]